MNMYESIYQIALVELGLAAHRLLCAAHGAVQRPQSGRHHVRPDARPVVHHLVAASPGRCITWSLHHLVISDRIHTCQPALQPLSTSRRAAPHAQTLPMQSLHCALCPCDRAPVTVRPCPRALTAALL